MLVYRFTRVASIVSVVMAIASPLPLLAQNNGPSDFALRSQGEISFIQSRPLGDMARNISFGYGANGTYLYRLDDDGFLSLRADLGFVQYGSEGETVPLSETIGGRIQVHVSTDNQFVPYSIGAQLTWPTGKVRPYANVGAGGQFFFTQSSVDDDGESDFNTTNQHDHTFTWVSGAGMYIPVHSRGTSVMVDLGVQYYTGGTAQYLRPGSIQDLPNSQILITPLQSSTRMYVVHMGVKFGYGSR